MSRLLEHQDCLIEKISGGYVYVKSDRWVPKQIYVWEKERDKVEDGEVVIFLDRNSRNFDITNLMKIKRKELAVLNRWYKDRTAEETPLLIDIIRIKQKRVELARKNGLVDARGNVVEDVKSSNKKWVENHREYRNSYIREYMRKRRLNPVLREEENRKKREYRHRCKLSDMQNL